MCVQRLTRIKNIVIRVLYSRSDPPTHTPHMCYQLSQKTKKVNIVYYTPNGNNTHKTIKYSS